MTQKIDHVEDMKHGWSGEFETCHHDGEWHVNWTDAKGNVTHACRCFDLDRIGNASQVARLLAVLLTNHCNEHGLRGVFEWEKTTSFDDLKKIARPLSELPEEL